MLDLLLNDDGDLDITDDGDIKVGFSKTQAILVRLRWIYGEWRLGPELGFPWYEDVLVKNPDTERIRQEIREAILSVDDITDASVTILSFDQTNRSITIEYNATTDDESIQEVVTLNG